MRSDDMRQAVPQSQQPTTPPDVPAGSVIGDVVRNVVKGTLQSVSTEMSRELDKEVAKRDALQGRLDASTSRAERASLRSQIATADENIAKLSKAITDIGTKTGVNTGVIAGTAPPFSGPVYPPFNARDDVPTTMIISVIAIIFIGFPLAIAFARLLWRRATAIGSPGAQLPADSARRFDQLGQAVDSIAIEVERISENQRYLTKVLSEPRAVMPVGAGEPPQPH